MDFSAMGLEDVVAALQFLRWIELVGGSATPLKNMKVNWDD